MILKKMSSYQMIKGFILEKSYNSDEKKVYFNK